MLVGNVIRFMCVCVCVCVCVLKLIDASIPRCPPCRAAGCVTIVRREDEGRMRQSHQLSFIYSPPRLSFYQSCVYVRAYVGGLVGVMRFGICGVSLSLCV
jgi:hypothetical protein